MMSGIMQSITSEIEALRSGRFIPYHKLALVVSILTMVIFGVIFSHGSVFEGTINVIDLDNSRYSQNLIDSCNSSSYIKVNRVFHYPVDPESLTRHDQSLGVLYIPRDTEKNVQAGKQAVNLGYFADYTNEAQNAEIIETLNEITGIYAAQASGAEETPISMKIRRMFNPTFSSTNATIISFIYFFSSLYLGLTTLMITGRLRVTQQWDNVVLRRTPIELIARLIPYVLIYVTAISIPTALLLYFGQLRFAGNYLAYLPSLFMTGLCFGMMALLYSWSSTDPGHGASMMIFLVPPGFILGGATMAVGVVPDWTYVLSHMFPLVWQYRFWRDFAMRGTELISMCDLYGMYLIYIAVLGLLITLRFYREQYKKSQPMPPAMAEE